MISIEDIKKFDFETIPVDSFWNTGIQKEEKMHHIHAYPAKFPAFITTKALEYARTNGLKPTKIADIFCGCGTTAFEAKRNSIAFWGCDISPVATLIAKTKSRKYQPARLQKYFNEIIEKFQNEPITNQYIEANQRLKYWYTEDQYDKLAHLKEKIIQNTPQNSDYRLFFLCAFSNILKPTSMWLTKSIKPQLDLTKHPVDVITAFNRQYQNMFEANNELKDLSNSQSDIVTCNFLDDTSKVPLVDMIITSPPYVTSYEYADLHQLSSLWLGFADDYRDLRTGSIGSSYHDYNFNKELKNLNETGSKIVFCLFTQQKSKASAVAKYFLDMQKVANKSYSMLSAKGMAFFVVGNTEYKDVRIDNAKHLSESLFNAGFKKIEVTKRKISNKILTPYRDKGGKFTSNCDGRKVYNEEFLIIGSK